MNHPPATLFDQFLKECLFLKNVSPRTLLWYQIAFKNFRATQGAYANALPRKPNSRRS